MNNLTKKICRTLSGAAACLIFLTGEAGASEAEVQYVKSLMVANEEVRSGESCMDMTLLSPVGKLKLEVNSQDIVKPHTLAQGEAVASYTAVWGMEGRFAVPFYVEEKDGETAAYWKYDGKWSKFIDKSGNVNAQAMLDAATLARLQANSQLIKDAETTFNDGIKRRINVILSGRDIGAFMKEIVAIGAAEEKKTGKEPVLAGQQEQINAVLDKLGDIPIELTVDVRANRITMLTADASPTIRSIAAAAVDKFLPQASADQREVIDRLLESCTLKIKAAYTRQNLIDPSTIVLPAEAKNAVDFVEEVKKAGDAKNKKIAAQ